MPQVRNIELVDNLSPDFQRRYESSFHLALAASMLQSLPACRGAWTMGAVDNGGTEVTDTTGAGYSLSKNSIPTQGIDGLAPYTNFDGSNDELYYTNNAQFNILGNDINTTSTYRGLMLGGWFNFDDAPALADQEHLIGVWSTVLADRAYRLVRLTDGTLRFQIGNGVSTPGVTCTTVMSTGRWYFCAGRWDPGVLEYVYCNDDDGHLEIVSGATIAAPLVTSSANFTIGAMLAGTDDRLDGRASLCWVCAANSGGDALIRTIYNNTRALFGV